VSAPVELRRDARAFMDTVVTIATARTDAKVEAGVDRAYRWFAHVERACSRFEPDSEVSRLAHRTGVAVPVSPVLFQTVRFALALARETKGAFDPTVGALMERRGFDRSYRTGRCHRSAVDGAGRATYRDIELDDAAETIRLRRPLVIDLGAVAKGLAVDLAAKELRAVVRDFAIEAGGDVVVSGRNAAGGLWRVGIQHPRQPEATIAILEVTDTAVCTSGDYMRQASSQGEHHIVDPRSGVSPEETVSMTVVAPSAMLADALSTAAFVLGRDRGLRLVGEHRADGLAVSGGLQRTATPGLSRYLATGSTS